MSETIERAAIRYQGTVYSVPRPGRHHNVAHMMNEQGMDTITMLDQGFVTSEGRFVDRKEAAVIAAAAGQLGIVRAKTNPVNQLFSEDVW